MEQQIITPIKKKGVRVMMMAILEAAGLSCFTFLIFYFLARLFSKSLSADSMNFMLSPKKQLNSKFNIEEYWAGDLPKQALDILDMFNYPDIYSHYRSQLPKGVLLHGLPGTGKTHFARMIAMLSDAQFFSASASQFDEIFVGKGAQRVRNLFESAKKATEPSFMEQMRAIYTGKPIPPKRAVIFIDELDAIGTRNGGLIQSTTHATTSQLLTCLDGLDSRGNIFVIAATNNLTQIDPAIRRSGRFDRVIEMPLPDEPSRLKLLKFYLKGRPGTKELLDGGILNQYAKLTDGFSAADLRNMANEAIMSAVQSSIEERKVSGNVDLKDNSLTVQNLKLAFELILNKIKKERPNYKYSPPVD